MPEACKGFTLPIGLPLIGSPDWCAAQEGIIATVKSWGIALLDWAIGLADRAEQWGWEVAQEGMQDIDELKARLNQEPSGGLGGFVDALKTVASTIAAVIDYLQAGFGYVVFSLGYSLKAFLCMVRNAQATPGYYDIPTSMAINVVSWTWKTLKTVRLGTPDFAALQFIGADINDWVEEMLDALAQAVSPVTIPSHADALEAYLTGTINDQMFACWMHLNDCHPDVWKPVLEARREQLTTVEQTEFVRRKPLGPWGADPLRAGITAAEMEQEKQWQTDSERALRSLGWIHQEEASAAVSLYDELPTIADHLHWLARNVDDLEYVRDYHLLDGFDAPAVVAGMVETPGYQVVGSSLSRNFWAEFGTELRAQGMRKIDAARHYAAHWLHPSPEQMKEFVYRLRVGRPPSEWDKTVQAYFAALQYPPELVARATTFQADDFRRIMSEQGYGYLDVGWFLATLYRVPALSYIRDMYRYGVITETELQGYHQDLGYSETDSVRFVGVDRSIKARLRAAESFGWTPSALSRALGLGLISADFDRQQMEGQGFNDAEIQSHQSRASSLVKERLLSRTLSRIMSRTITQVTTSYSQGALSKQGATTALTNLGVPSSQAGAMLDIEELKFQTGLLKQTVSAIKKSFLKGRVDAGKAIELLTSAGMQQPFVDQTVASWQLQLQGPERQLGAAEVRKAVFEGILSPQEAMVRLANLGYSPDDVSIIMAEVQQLILTAEERQAAGQDRQQLADARRAQQAAAAAERARKQALQAMMKQAPPTRLAKWLHDGVITLADFTARLTEYGWAADNIENAARDALGLKIGDALP